MKLRSKICSRHPQQDPPGNGTLTALREDLSFRAALFLIHPSTHPSTVDCLSVMPDNHQAPDITPANANAAARRSSSPPPSSLPTPTAAATTSASTPTPTHQSAAANKDSNRRDSSKDSKDAFCRKRRPYRSRTPPKVHVPDCDFSRQRWTLRFRDPALEREYLKYNESLIATRCQRLGAIALFVFAGVVAVDYDLRVILEGADTVQALRLIGPLLGFGFGVIIILLPCSRRTWPYLEYILTALLAIEIAALIVCNQFRLAAMLGRPHEYNKGITEAQQLLALKALFSVGLFFVPVRFVCAVVVFVVTLFLHGLMTFLYGSPEKTERDPTGWENGWKNLLMFFVTLFVALIAQRMIETFRRKEFVELIKKSWRIRQLEAQLHDKSDESETSKGRSTVLENVIHGLETASKNVLRMMAEGVKRSSSSLMQHTRNRLEETHSLMEECIKTLRHSDGLLDIDANQQMSKNASSMERIFHQQIFASTQRYHFASTPRMRNKGGNSPRDISLTIHDDPLAHSDTHSSPDEHTTHNPDTLVSPPSRNRPLTLKMRRASTSAGGHSSSVSAQHHKSERLRRSPTPPVYDSRREPLGASTSSSSLVALKQPPRRSQTSPALGTDGIAGGGGGDDTSADGCQRDEVDVWVEKAKTTKLQAGFSHEWNWDTLKAGEDLGRTPGGTQLLVKVGFEFCYPIVALLNDGAPHARQDGGAGGGGGGVGEKKFYHMWRSEGRLKHDELARRLTHFLKDVEDAYMPNLYHNFWHAVEVCHSSVYLVRQLGMWESEVFTEIDQLALAMAALCHDVGHFGRNNDFLKATSHKWAVLYNDMSPMEHFHSALTFHLLTAPRNNFLGFLTGQQWKDIRAKVIDLILATDISDNGEKASKMRIKMKGESKEGEITRPFEYLKNAHDSWMVCQMCIKAADISHAAKEWTQHLEWTRRVTAEFFDQGDEETRMGLPKWVLGDRHSLDIADSQRYFISVMCMDVFQILASLDESGLLEKDVLREMQQNKNRWESCLRIKQKNIKISFDNLIDRMRQPSDPQSTPLQPLPFSTGDLSCLFDQDLPRSRPFSSYNKHRIMMKQQREQQQLQLQQQQQPHREVSTSASSSGVAGPGANAIPFMLQQRQQQQQQQLREAAPPQQQQGGHNKTPPARTKSPLTDQFERCLSGANPFTPMSEETIDPGTHAGEDLAHDDEEEEINPTVLTPPNTRLYSRGVTRSLQSVESAMCPSESTPFTNLCTQTITNSTNQTTSIPPQERFKTEDMMFEATPSAASTNYAPVHTPPASAHAHAQAQAQTPPASSMYKNLSAVPSLTASVYGPPLVTLTVTPPSPSVRVHRSGPRRPTYTSTRVTAKLGD
ncbi:unnamed protein product [Vitrella brassicaformis CCMP3155]|uniref:Phosphodiesterase n=3 Tax=Vitrella brassicaformis TaxID=1169539 RepID=A0A0G4EXW6_VITBC|nr:unnamed protein product [Vitrella brassicaformis CCMP3155]|eukprot:CEM03561.1 unnamed protein product [Vitrella brassicaformis CCMP3155]